MSPTQRRPAAPAREIARRLHGILQASLDAGHTRGSEQVAAHLVQGLRSGDNPKRVRANHVVPGPTDTASPRGSLPLSTYSERVKATHVQRFLAEINRRLPREAHLLLAQLPPDGGDVCGIIDGHQESYHYDVRNHVRPCFDPLCRCHYMVASHGNNKASAYAHEWVVMALAWQHQGQLIIAPIHLKPIFGLGFTPRDQVATFARVQRRHHLPARITLLDRYYDAKDVRTESRLQGVPIGFRVAWNARALRVLLNRDTGKAVTVQDMERRVAREGEVHTWRDKRGKPHLERHLVVPVRFPGDSADYDLTVGVELVAAPGPGRWRVTRPIAVAVPAGLGGLALRLYRRRWRIETLFHLWALDQNKPRPKNINSHAIHYAAFVVSRSLAIAGLSVWRATMHAAGLPVSPLLSSIEFGRWVLSVEPAPD